MKTTETQLVPALLENNMPKDFPMVSDRIFISKGGPEDVQTEHNVFSTHQHLIHHGS